MSAVGTTLRLNVHTTICPHIPQPTNIYFAQLWLKLLTLVFTQTLMSA